MMLKPWWVAKHSLRDVLFLGGIFVKQEEVSIMQQSFVWVGTLAMLESSLFVYILPGSKNYVSHSVKEYLIQSSEQIEQKKSKL